MKNVQQKDDLIALSRKNKRLTLAPTGFPVCRVVFS